MPKNKTFHSFAKWFRRLSLIMLVAPLAVIICYAIINATKAGTSLHDNTLKAQQYIIIINAVAGVLWFFLAIVMFFAAGTLRGVGASPLAIRVGLIITFVLVFAEIILSIVFIYHPEIKDVTKNPWVPWVQNFMPLINIAGYVVGAVVGTKLRNALA